MPTWADGSGLEAGRFRSLLVGPGLGAAGAAALQDVGRLVRGARDVGDLQAASARLAAAVEAGGAEWRHGVSYARDEAVYAAAQRLVPKGGALGEGGRFILASAPSTAAGPMSEAAHPGIEAVERGARLLSRMGRWGKVAAGVIGVGLGVYLSFKGTGHEDSEQSATGRRDWPTVVEHAPPTEPDGDTPAKPAEHSADVDAGGREEHPDRPSSPDTVHEAQRRAEARTDPHRDVGDPNRVRLQGRHFKDIQSGYDVYVDGERVVVVRPDGKRHTVFNNPRRNTQKRITAGIWVPVAE